MSTPTKSVTAQWTCSCAAHPVIKSPTGRAIVPGIIDAACDGIEKNRISIGMTERGRAAKLTQSIFRFTDASVLLLETQVHSIQQTSVDLT